MLQHLQISDPAERRLVVMADMALAIAAVPARLLASRQAGEVRRILLFRLERIGDLLMTLPAIRAVGDLAPQASIDLMVGSWNAPLANMIPGSIRVMTMDAAWLARESGGLPPLALARHARSLRQTKYDLAINFEGDIRSHTLMALTGARRRIGFDHAGGGPLLTDRVSYDGGRHVAASALALVATAFDRTREELELRYLHDSNHQGPLLAIPPAAAARAEARLAGCRRPVIGVHVPGGREIKQWPPERFANVAAGLVRATDGTIVLTGSAGDDHLVGPVRERISMDNMLDLCGKLDLPDLAATLQHLTCLVTGDTGPMHLAEAVGTSVVAVFGPSDPRRYGPRLSTSRTVRIDLPCSPCNRIRRPPRRCVGHAPDCLIGVEANVVLNQVTSVLEAQARSG